MILPDDDDNDDELLQSVRARVCAVRGVNRPIVVIIIIISKNDSGWRVRAKKKKFGVVRKRIRGATNGGS